MRDPSPWHLSFSFQRSERSERVSAGIKLMPPEKNCIEKVCVIADVARIDREIGRTDFGDLGLKWKVSTISPYTNSSIFDLGLSSRARRRGRSSTSSTTFWTNFMTSIHPIDLKFWHNINYRLVNQTMPTNMLAVTDKLVINVINSF